MAEQPLPDVRAIKKLLASLKGYTAYKANQLQTAGGDPNVLEQALKTVDIWADDVDNDGKEWGRRKDADADEKIQDSDNAQQRVQQDEQQATKEAEFRSKTDMNEVKKDLNKKLDDYGEAMKQLAEADQPGFKDKLPQIQKDNEAAKTFVDEDLEKAMDASENKVAQKRQQRKKVAQGMDERAQDGRQWKQDYGGQPDKFPAGQRADVVAALDTVVQCCDQKLTELKPIGTKAKPHPTQIKKVRSWAESMKPNVDTQGNELAKAKATGKSGTANARSVFTKVEKFQDSVETDANVDIDLFRRWTDRNNRLAAKWINSNSAKHKQWAEAWQETRQ